MLQQQQPETQTKPQSSKRLLYHQIWVLLLTFSAYAAFHASRKPPSIVKPALSSAIDGWPPFAGPSGPHRLGELDLAFLASYSAGMYFSGHLADRIPLRLFLVSGMLGSAAFTVAFGLGFWFRIHTLPYFLAVQIACGLFQSVGWPCVVAIVGNWFGKSKRGLIMGIWNSHTSVGNVVGSVLASSVLDYGWGWSFVLPGFLLLLVALAVSRFLVACPQDVGLEIPPGDLQIPDSVSMELVDCAERHPSEKGVVLDSSSSSSSSSEEEEAKAVLIDNISDKRLHSGDLSSEAIGFLDAWRLPDVAPFAFSLFFSKLVAYTFLYWLPFYISHTAVAGVHLSHKTAGILSTIFDVGGVLGGILAGYISDKIEARGVTSIMFLLLSIPALIFYRMFGNISMMMNIGLMFLSGLLVNGPYSLITTAVAADLGTQSLIKGNSRALATVTAIIDGTGSVGAALGPLMAGYISTRGWNSVFFMLILSILLAGLMLIQIAKTEIKGKLYKEISIGST